jgi:hypothetical protein
MRPSLARVQSCLSNSWLLIFLLLMSPVSASAEWMAVERDYLSPGRQTVYVDSDTIRREGSLVTVSQLIDFKWMQGNQGLGPLGFGPHRYFSTQTLKQFDCATQRVRLLAFTEFSEHMGAGTPARGYVDSENWLSVERESINQAVWEVACPGKAKMVP